MGGAESICACVNVCVCMYVLGGEYAGSVKELTTDNNDNAVKKPRLASSSLGLAAGKG